MKYVSPPTPQKLCTDYKPFLQYLFKGESIVLLFCHVVCIKVTEVEWGGSEIIMTYLHSSSSSFFPLCVLLFQMSSPLLKASLLTTKSLYTSVNIHSKRNKTKAIMAINCARWVILLIKLPPTNESHSRWIISSRQMMS